MKTTLLLLVVVLLVVMTTASANCDYLTMWKVRHWYQGSCFTSLKTGHPTTCYSVDLTDPNNQAPLAALGLNATLLENVCYNGWPIQVVSGPQCDTLEGARLNTLVSQMETVMQMQGYSMNNLCCKINGVLLDIVSDLGPVVLAQYPPLFITAQQKNWASFASIIRKSKWCQIDTITCNYDANIAAAGC